MGLVETRRQSIAVSTIWYLRASMNRPQDTGRLSGERA